MCTHTPGVKLDECPWERSAIKKHEEECEKTDGGWETGLRIRKLNLVSVKGQIVFQHCKKTKQITVR